MPPPVNNPLLGLALNTGATFQTEIAATVLIVLLNVVLIRQTRLRGYDRPAFQGLGSEGASIAVAGAHDALISRPSEAASRSKDRATNHY
jgi:hypothetical protein